jgi:SAM-dependent methyltransferase/tetratricopeptide (TPR) repeat protein
MNRKERRAAGKRGNVPTPPDALFVGSAELSTLELAAEASRSHGRGRFDEAREICRRILAREPAHVQSLNLLGLMAQASGDHRGAVKMFAKALASDETDTACHYNAGNSYQALGQTTKAVAHFSKALAFGMHDKAAAFILQSPIIATYVARITGKWPLPLTHAELFGADGLAPLANDLFLRSAMEAATLPGVQLELLLGYARAEMLRLAGDDNSEVGDEIIAFAGALARQCFMNEYVYAQPDAEAATAGTLRDRLLQNLASGAPVAPLAVAVVAAYHPLHTLPGADALLDRDSPASITGLLRVQLREPREEMSDRSAIATLGAVKDSVSLEVMRQYEENPYPRWTINPLNALAANQARGRIVPAAARQAEQDILIAGCGTGRHAAQVAQLYTNARVLAVDISMPSLAYARRKTRELGLRNIEYAQADILELGTIDRSFDRIESVGVLHHLAEPAAGWRVLVSLLRPGGTMRIGLYSELARRIVVEARARIAARGYRATVDDIRRCRQDMIGESEKWLTLIGGEDFYHISGCRDLLFNVMEHRFTIPEIAAFLNDNDLSFLGFDPFDDPAVIEQFHKQFPGVADEANLEQWSRFETDHPETFLGMYIFTARKNAR